MTDRLSTGVDVIDRRLGGRSLSEPLKLQLLDGVQVDTSRDI